MLGKASRANRITDKQGLRNGGLWQSPIFLHLPILVLFSMMELGRGMWTYAKLNHAARQAGRYCMVRGSANPANPTELRAVVDRHCNGMELSDITVSTLWNPDDATPNADPALVERGDIVEVRLTYPFKLVTGGLVLPADTLQMGATTQMIVAN